MEGVGSRLGRTSSRYGSSSSVFSGPVRKWKRRWVHVSYQSNNSSRSHNGNNGNDNSNASSALVLCRWTPISPTQSGDNSVKTEEPPRRKFRYVPVVALEEQKQEAVEKVDDKAKTHKAHPFITGAPFKKDYVFETLNTEGLFTEEIQAVKKNIVAQQDSNMSDLNLDLGLKGHDEHVESDVENDEVGD